MSCGAVDPAVRLDEINTTGLGSTATSMSSSPPSAVGMAKVTSAADQARPATPATRRWLSLVASCLQHDCRGRTSWPTWRRRERRRGQLACRRLRRRAFPAAACRRDRRRVRRRAPVDRLARRRRQELTLHPRRRAVRAERTRRRCGGDGRGGGAVSRHGRSQRGPCMRREPNRGWPRRVRAGSE